MDTSDVIGGIIGALIVFFAGAVPLYYMNISDMPFHIKLIIDTIVIVIVCSILYLAYGILKERK